ncbi:hypothetical protein LEP1GSC059_3617 [Leptospira noguchii serovar Panama str. CZ214]|uniref:Uncharacterized protein n=1 Tax=Leptospira noguchii serovar Panama str. CZ214 TaxID=1001595 RepID=T0H0W6_9LEPT|nr:hypothetical protein LEP1GSC059_3617 [Leptospira noguchii serovar Panama str. CZ214]
MLSRKKFSFLLVLLPFLFFTINSCSRIWSIGILNQKDKTVTLILKLQIPVSQHHFQSWITGHHSKNLRLISEIGFGSDRNRLSIRIDRSLKKKYNWRTFNIMKVLEKFF